MVGGASSVGNKAEPSAIGTASTTAPIAEMTVPKTSAAMPNLAGLASGNHARSVRKCTPASRTAGIARAMRKPPMATISTRTAPPAPWAAIEKIRSPRRRLRDGNDNEVVMPSAATPRKLGADGFGYRLALVDERLGKRRVAQALGRLLALAQGVEHEALEHLGLGRVGRLLGQDHERHRRDRVRGRVLGLVVDLDLEVGGRLGLLDGGRDGGGIGADEVAGRVLDLRRAQRRTLGVGDLGVTDRAVRLLHR